MSRARNIKPGFYKNAELLECSMAARLLAPGLWMMADREGRLEDRPKQIKIEIFPCDNVDVNQLLDELAFNQHIKRYEINGKRFIQICKFKAHQRPHSNETESLIPDENGGYSGTKKKILSTMVESASTKTESASSLTTDTLTTDSLNPSKKEEGSLRSPSPPKPPSKKPDDDVAADSIEFWTGWIPYEMSRGSKKSAIKSYIKARKETDRANLIAKRDAYLNECHRIRCKTKHVSAWLNARGWEDDYEKIGNDHRGNIGPHGGTLQPGVFSSYDTRDAASIAHDGAKLIIAKRKACRDAEAQLIAETRSGRSGPADAPTLADLRQPADLRGQGSNDGIPRSDVPIGSLGLPH